MLPGKQTKHGEIGKPTLYHLVWRGKKKVDRTNGRVAVPQWSDQPNWSNRSRTLIAINHNTSDGCWRDFNKGTRTEKDSEKKAQAIRCEWMFGDKFDALPEEEFPWAKPEGFEAAGCRVSSSGFLGWRWRWRWGGGGSLSSVMEECGAVSLGSGIPFHTVVKKKEGKGWGGVGPLFSQSFAGWTSCSSGLFSIPRNSSSNSLSLLKVTLLKASLC